MRYGQPLSDLAPDGSYLQDYDRVQTATYYQQVGEPVGLYFRGIDPSLPDTQYRMLASMSKVLDSPMFNASTSAFLGNWLISFTLWAQAQGATVAQPVGGCCGVGGGMHRGLGRPHRGLTSCVGGRACVFSVFFCWVRA